jgi:hypothetical protein
LSLAGFSSQVKCLWVRLGAYFILEHLKGASLGKALALPKQFKLGWKDLLRTNTIAYYEHA